MKIKLKFTLQFFVLFSLIIVISVLGIYNAIQIQDSFEYLDAELMPISNSLKNMYTQSILIISSTMEFSLVDDSMLVTAENELSELEIEKEILLTKQVSAKNLFNMEFLKYSELMNRNFPDDDFHLSSIHTSWMSFISCSQKILDYSTHNSNNNEFFSLLDTFSLERETLFQNLDDATVFIENEIQLQQTLVNSLLYQTIISILIISTVFIIVSFFVRQNISQSIIMPLTNLGNLTKEIAKGNLSVSIPDMKSNDEINELYEKVRLMTKSMSEVHQKSITTERLSAIGELSARLAHDIRNPLTVLVNSLLILKSSSHNHSDVEKRQFKYMDKALQRISHQIDDVLEFVRSSDLFIARTSLQRILKTSIESIQIPSNININLPTTDRIIFCDIEKMKIVFINLLTNSIQALGERGQITIRFMELIDDDKIVIEVEDTGPGIPDELQSKIFEPLFTTKQKGTGLGLASVRNIVEQHEGTLTVHNNPTTFKITLPIRLNLDFNHFDNLEKPDQLNKK